MVMLNFFATIKKTPGVRLVSAVVLLPLTAPAGAWAQGSAAKDAAKPQPADEKYGYFATARLLSPDRKTELSTIEMKVNLKGTSTAVLKGRSVSVTLESEPNEFRKAQMLRVSAAGGEKRAGEERATLNAGMFRLIAHQENSFLYTDKNRGWLLEVRLRPVQPTAVEKKTEQRDKSKAPVRNGPRKPKRLPA